jgi:FG-GAP-like repeat/PASTA domain
VTANFGGISVLQNAGSGSFRAHRDYPNCRPCFADSQPGFDSLEIADLNQDGKPDIVTRNEDELPHVEYGLTVSVFLNKGKGTFKASRSYRTQPSEDLPNSWFALVDLNGDGTRDVVALRNTGTVLFVLLNKGDGTLKSRYPMYRSGGEAADVADLDGNGKPDIVVANERSVSVRLNRPGLCNVQPVEWMTLAAAKRTLARVNCRVGKVSRRYSTSVKTGRVISQRPKFGAVMRGGGRIALVVSLGRKR